MMPTTLQEYDTGLIHLLNASPIGVTVVEQATGNYLLVNSAFVKMIDAQSAEELFDVNPAHTWANKEDVESARKVLANNENLVDFEVERIRMDGSTCWFLLNSQRIIFEGKEARIIWQIDITDRRETEDQTAKSEKRLLNIFEASPYAIGITRKSDAKILYANSKYASLLGYEHKEIMKLSAADLWANPSDRIEFRKEFDEKGFVSEREAQGVRKDGSVIWVSITWKPFRYKNRESYIFWFNEITEQKQNQAALAFALKQAKTASLAKSEFLASMSHEIRTPLNGVLGLAQLMKDTQLDSDQLGYVDTILSSGQTLLAILNDVLDMSKIEAGRLELEEKPIPLHSLISTITIPFQNLADEKNLKLVVCNNVATSSEVSGDAVRLRQVIWNLLSNAIKFTDEGCVTLTIDDTSSHQRVLPTETGRKRHQFCFTIEDTGSGIAGDRLDSIFEAFTQEDNSITRTHGGTGLGLSIVKQLTELMGGSISVESNVGQGSTFKVILPFIDILREQADPVFSHKKEQTVPVRNSLNVLVAEDNPINALITTKFLEKSGHSVRHVENGELVVEAAKDGWADVILMDIHMPKMNGVDATKTIMKNGLSKRTPIIGLTADAFTDRHVVFREAGMNDVLTKPFTEQQLTDILAANNLMN